MASTGALSVEYRVERLDGTVVRVWDRARSRTTEDGRQIMEGTLTDVTDRPDGDPPPEIGRFGQDIVVVDRLSAEGVLEQVYMAPDSYRRLFGVDVEPGPDPIDAYFAAIHPEDRMRAESMTTRVARGGIVSEEYRVIGYDGRTRWFWDRTRGVPQDDGSVLLYGVLVDVTEAVTTRITLAQAEAALRALTDAVPDFLFTVELGERDELVAVATTPGLASILGGHVPASTQGQIDLALARVHKDDLAAVEDALARARRGENPTFRIRVHALDGSLRQVRVALSTSPLGDGSVIVHGIMSDVTDL